MLCKLVRAPPTHTREHTHVPWAEMRLVFCVVLLSSFSKLQNKDGKSFRICVSAREPSGTRHFEQIKCKKHRGKDFSIRPCSFQALVL